MSIFKAFNSVLGVGTKPSSAPRVSSHAHDRPTDPSQSHLPAFQNSWQTIKNSLSSPRQRTQLLESTSIKEKLELMWECLAIENNIPITNLNPSRSAVASQTPECVEYFLENNVPGNLVSLSLPDQPIGVKGLVIKFFLSVVVFMDEKFVVHAKVHKPLVRLLRSCVEPELDSDEGEDSGWGSSGVNYEEAVVELMCHLCARIKTYPELLLVFIHNRSRSSQAQPAEIFPEPSAVEALPITPHSPISSGGGPPTTRKSVHFSPVPRPPSPMTSDFSAAGNMGNSPTHTTLSSSFSSSSHHLYNEASRKSDSKLAAIGNALKGDSDMLIFSYLLRFLHREGRTGDLARAGLLFLMELAMGRCPHIPGDACQDSHTSTITEDDQPTPADTVSMAFGEWVLDSDFADVLGASLGAAYGLLPSKLVITPRDPSSEDSTGRMVLGGMGIHFTEGLAESAQSIQEKEREERRQRLLIGLGVSGSAEFRGQIDLFLKMIEFAQDVMRNVNPSTLDHYVSPTELLLASQSQKSALFGSSTRPAVTTATQDPKSTTDESGPSPSEIVASAVSSTVLLSIRKSFLTGIIYPSLLECSEYDGSAVAVMSYLEAILSLLETDGELSDSVLRFLMAEDDEDLELDAGLRPSSNHAEVMQLGPSSPFNNPNRRNSGAISIIKADFHKAKSGRRVGDKGDRLISDTGITYFNSLGRFTLKDLLVNNIQSTHSPTATAALKLLHVILVRHDRYALTLLDIIPDPTATAFPFPHSAEISPTGNGYDSDSQKSDQEESEFVYPIKGDQVDLGDEPDGVDEEFKYPGESDAVKSTSNEDEEFQYPTPTKPQSTSALSSFTPGNKSYKKNNSTSRSHCLKPSLDLVKRIHCSPCPTYRAHRDEIEFLSSLVELIDPSSMVMKADSVPGSLSTAFQHYLLDAEAELTGTATFRRGLLFDYVSASVIPSSEPVRDKRQSLRPGSMSHIQPISKQESPLDFIDHPVIRHRLSAETPVVSSILESLAKFFVQPPALNLILTGCVATLASCPTRSLEGWMLPPPNPDDGDDDSFDQSILSSCTPRNPIVDDDEGDDRSIDFAVDEYVSSHRKSSSRRTFESSFSRSQGAGGADCLLEVYRQLAVQVAGYRKTINNFDRYLKERRQGLIFVENLEDALDTLTGTMIQSESLMDKEHRMVNDTARQPTEISKKPNAMPIEQPSKPKDSSFFSFFKGSNYSKPSPPTARSHTARTSEDETHRLSGERGHRAVAVKPFSEHYQQTGSIKLTIVPVSTPGSTKKRDRSLLKLNFSDDETDSDEENNPGPDTPTKKTLHGSHLPATIPPFRKPQSASPSSPGPSDDHQDPTVISLSMLLDNVVILEESIKELGAIISARKSLGIDPVRIL